MLCDSGAEIYDIPCPPDTGIGAMRSERLSGGIDLHTAGIYVLQARAI